MGATALGGSSVTLTCSIRQTEMETQSTYWMYNNNTLQPKVAYIYTFFVN